MEAVINEISAQKDFFKNIGSSPSTIYFGGGTPSVLSPEQLGRIVAALRDTFGLIIPAKAPIPGELSNEAHASGELSNGKHIIEEFTIEVNPNDITPEYASFLVDIGVNRVSMGMQSFVDSHLKWMNRRHTSQEGIQAYGILRDAGIENISLDLIFGYTPLSDKEWEYNIDTMISLAPEHISAYQMSIEPGSCLSAMSRKGLYTPPADEECLKQYTMLQTKLTVAGYNQYEISNFARQKSVQKSVPGTTLETAPKITQRSFCETMPNPTLKILQNDTSKFSQNDLYVSQHNSSYWNGTPYLGLGPAAHSYTGIQLCQASTRLWNTPSVKKYCSYYCGTGSNDCGICPSGGASGADATCNIVTEITSGAAGNTAIDDFAIGSVVGFENLTLEDLFNEKIMLGLRRTSGFSLDELALIDASLLRRILPQINRLVMSGHLIMEDGAGFQDLLSSRRVVTESNIQKNIRIPADKLFISDSIIRELFV